MQQRQPNSHHCFACGLQNAYGLQLEFYDDGREKAWCECTIAEEYQGFPGVAHGGIVAAILDEVMVRSGMIADQNRFRMTAKMELRFRSPVPLGEPLRAVGRLTRDRGRLAQACGELHSLDGTLLAEASATLVDLPQNIAMDQTLEDLGWRVYD